MRIDRSLAERQRRGENFDEGRFHSRPAFRLVLTFFKDFAEETFQDRGGELVTHRRPAGKPAAARASDTRDVG
ncbi:MAG: hypothetical protein J2P53_04710, partial [Bradyrhizobiaceae bacterium]|nr:hypothetical protein [Bradyrhizobiaceae bacterium]